MKSRNCKILACDLLSFDQCSVLSFFGCVPFVSAAGGGGGGRGTVGGESGGEIWVSIGVIKGAGGGGGGGGWKPFSDDGGH